MIEEEIFYPACKGEIEDGEVTLRTIECAGGCGWGARSKGSCCGLPAVKRP